VPAIKKRSEEKNVVFVHDAVNDFLSSAEVKSLQPNTREEYEMNLKVFAQWCGSHTLIQNKKESAWSVDKAREHHDAIALHKVNAQSVYFFLEFVKETRRPSRADRTHISSHTLAQYVKDIKRLLNWCLLDEQYSQHVTALTINRIKKPQLEETIIETFSQDQIEAMFKACNKEAYEHLEVRDKAILAVLLDTGIRASELCTLTIGNVCLDTNDPHVTVFGKGRKWGQVGLGQQSRRYLQKYFRDFREPTIEYDVQTKNKNMTTRQLAPLIKQEMESSVFFVNRTGQPLTTNGLYQIIERLGTWADIQDVRCSPHTWRHTFAVMFMRNNGDIYKLSKLLRHSSVKVTEEYLKSLKQSEARRGAKSVLDSM
jgi:integrase/recombinase XerD